MAPLRYAIHWLGRVLERSGVVGDDPGIETEWSPQRVYARAADQETLLLTY